MRSFVPEASVSLVMKTATSLPENTGSGSEEVLEDCCTGLEQISANTSMVCVLYVRHCPEDFVYIDPFHPHRNSRRETLLLSYPFHRREN